MDRDKLAQQQIDALNRNEFDEAIRIAQLSISDPFTPDTFSFNSSGILIDFGNHRVDRGLILQGMEAAERFISDPNSDPSLTAKARYNFSNGYAALAFVCENSDDKDGRLKNWRLQRDELQKLVLDRKSIPANLITEVLTNFGNVLDELGRGIEAIDMWNQVLEIDPNHPVALGSMGQAYFRLLGIQPKHSIRLIEASRANLELAVSDPKLIEIHAALGTLESYERSLQDAKDAGAKLAMSYSEFEQRIQLLRTHHVGWEPDKIHLEWARSRLLLTTNPYPEWCPDTLKDDLYFDGLFTEPNEAGRKRFTELAHTLNQIKEDYALARYLLHESSNPEKSNSLSSVTQFADTLDYADFGLSSGMLKSSIRTSVDIFDKIANFMNRYFKLGIPDKKVSFFSVWYEKGITDTKKRTESIFLSQLMPQSGWLRGIKDVAENLNFYPAPSKNVRNKVTHDYLIIENSVKPTVKLHGMTITVDAHEYGRQMLMMVKGTVVNLVALVQREEALRKSNADKVIVPMEFRYAKGISDELSANNTDEI